MYQHEASTPGSLVIASENWTDPNTARAAMRERLRAAEAEIETTTRRLLSLIRHDGQKDGRVSVRLLVKTVMGEALPWESQ